MNDSTKSSSEDSSSGQLFQKISNICVLVNTEIGEKTLLDQSLGQVMAFFGAKRGSIFIAQEDNTKNLVLMVAQGMAVGDKEAMVKQMGEGVVGRVAASKQPIVVEDIANDDRFKDYKARRSYNTNSFICAPLLVKDKLIGVINITDKESGNQFSKEELQLLDFLASQIALNYQRIRLYQKFKKIIRESQNLRDELGRSSKEADLLKKQVVLQEKLASIGKLAGGIAHEFNNPLDGVMRYTNLCLENLGEEELVRGYLLEIKQGLNRMAGIVKSLLACSRNTALTSQQVDMNHAVDQAVQGVQLEILQKDIKIEKRLGENLPKIADLGLERAVSNLLRNAADAIEKEGVIQIRTFLKNGKIFCEIKDSGCGINADKIEQIFEPFYTTKDIGRGCGLGLTIVSEIVKSYNGEIQVDSKPGKGTAFTVCIPVN